MSAIRGLLAASALTALLSGPAFAQQAKASAQGGSRIIVTESNLPNAYTALGAVTANVHPKSISPKTSTHDLLDAELRKEAARLGADAVIQVRYTMRNPMMSQKGSDAMGVAVKFASIAAAPAQPAPPAAAAAPAPVVAQTPLPAPTAPQAVASAPVTPGSPPQVAAPPASRQFAAATPQPAAPAAPAPAPVAPAVVARPPHAASVDMIVLLDQDITGQRYSRVGDVRSEVHQKSMFPKTPSKDLLNADLKAQALKLGADAVIQVKYSMHDALTSTKGDVATGIAVRFE